MWVGRVRRGKIIIEINLEPLFICKSFSRPARNGRKMAKPVRAKPQLTKAILDMKFMKRTKDRLERERRDTEGHSDLYAPIITHDMRHATGNFIIEPSFTVCEDLMQGRLSFKGMNPEIERLMELEGVKEEDMEKDVSDEQLSRQFSAFKRSRDGIKEEPAPVPRKRIRKERK